MSEHEEYMPIYNDPMYWSYLTRDKQNTDISGNSNKTTTETKKTNDTTTETKKTNNNNI
jgi:hypothetical protein